MTALPVLPTWSNFRVLLLPGWLNSPPAHWQSRWETLYGFERVLQSDWEWPRRGDWMARLDEVLLTTPDPAPVPASHPAFARAKPVLLVAHSLGCQLVAAWAEHSAHTARVRGALLVAVPDTARADTPHQLSTWRRVPGNVLPFTTRLLFSSNDPFCTPPRAQAMAATWGARARGLGALGHINGDSGLGDWPAGLQALARLATHMAADVAADAAAGRLS